MKIKTIVYNPNIKYGSTTQRNSTNSDLIKPSMSSSASKEKFKAEPWKNYSTEVSTSDSTTIKSGGKADQRNYSSSTTPQTLPQSMSSVTPKGNNAVLNNYPAQDLASTNESKEQKVSDCKSVEQSKSMEY